MALHGSLLAVRRSARTTEGVHLTGLDQAQPTSGGAEARMAEIVNL